MRAKTNVIIALKNILDHNSTRLTPIYKSNGSVNATGDNLEFFVKDMFCKEAMQYSYEDQKQKEYMKYLSWTGDSSHFPDLIVQGGVGVESKKLNNDSKSTIALNSSYPKDYITRYTQNYPLNSLYFEPDVDNLNKKPVIYAIGNLNTNKKDYLDNQLISLWFVYGNTIVPNSNYYKNIIKGIRDSIKNVNSNIKIEDSKELARVKGVDKLSRTNMRVRGMYELEHPAKIFESYVKSFKVPKGKSKIFVVILQSDLDEIKRDMEDKWDILSNELNI
ncbi:NgoPII family restriction endonuclease [Lactobacillus sp. LL6]|uniref:NgoPII family restriction endonuclease n=1 Tax=Lactobacillus sp. LL6 TaxID=2596827 RepID=UPI0011863D64|nr:NgoPII family restriction endonuclease [Lactobacillus sp. LL6]TSO26378.1 NgoPII family restriction endonuclease [Lactobacillus sp. LL6]